MLNVFLWGILLPIVLGVGLIAFLGPWWGKGPVLSENINNDGFWEQLSPQPVPVRERNSGVLHHYTNRNGRRELTATVSVEGNVYYRGRLMSDAEVDMILEGIDPSTPAVPATTEPEAPCTVREFRRLEVE